MLGRFAVSSLLAAGLYVLLFVSYADSVIGTIAFRWVCEDPPPVSAGEFIRESPPPVTVPGQIGRAQFDFDRRLLKAFR